MNLKAIMLSKRSQFQKVTYDMIPFMTFQKTKLWGWSRDQWLPGLMGGGKGDYKDV